KYTQFQAANALGDAAKNPGAAGNMMGMLAGVNLGGMVGGNLAGAQAAASGSGSGGGGNAAPAGGPPPLPNAATWFFGIAGQQVGPLSAEAVSAKVASGEITRDTLAWKQGMAGWEKAGTVDDLSGLFAVVPPPLPEA
ncbi:MAG: DUF4339 domain-containing protein, partial [Planctomycetaceae bacterium]|nr:DUF4339 domain-containing protein [Planctomycetaceae bacterium]